MKKFLRVHLFAFLLQGVLIGSGIRGLSTTTDFCWFDYLALGFVGLTLLSFILTLVHYMEEVKADV